MDLLMILDVLFMVMYVGKENANKGRHTPQEPPQGLTAFKEQRRRESL